MKCLSQKMQAVKAINLKPSVIDAKTCKKKSNHFAKKIKYFRQKSKRLELSIKKSVN